MNDIETKDLCKNFEKFKLQNINISVEQGSVLGLIGENGAGKTTLIKLIIGLLKKDSGQINIFNKSLYENEQYIKENIGYVCELVSLPNDYKPYYLEKVLSKIYKNWDCEKFYKYLELFSIDPYKKFENLSRGMRTKLPIAAALSHNPKILILDEPTSGLDPIIRNEILDIFRDFMLDEQHSMIISSHITSDLETIADSIAFLHDGNLIFQKTINELNESYGFINCSKEDLQKIDKTAVYAIRYNNFGVEALINPVKLTDNFTISYASIEQIMLFLTKYSV